MAFTSAAAVVIPRISSEKGINSIAIAARAIAEGWDTVKVENTLEFAAALRRAGVPFALHVYQKGRHGLGLGDQPPFAKPHPWAANCAFWLREQGFAR